MKEILKECILAAAIIVSPGQTKKLANPDDTASTTIKKGEYVIDVNAVKSATDLSDFSLSFEFGSNNTSYNSMYLVTGSGGVENLAYTTPKTQSYLILKYDLQENYQSLQTFFVDESQEIKGSIDNITGFNKFMENYVTLKVNFSLVTIFEELAEGLKNLALGFVNAFSGLGPIFYKNGLTFVSIFLIGGVALTVGFWAVDKIFGLAKMGLGSLGKARAKKSKKGQ